MASYNPNDYLQNKFPEQFDFEEIFKYDTNNNDLDIALYPLFQPIQTSSTNQALELPHNNAEIDFVTPSSLVNTPTTSPGTDSTCDSTSSKPATQKPIQVHRGQSARTFKTPKLLLCDYPDCQRPGPFSTKGSLTRHRKTQHLAGGPTLKCSKGCDKLFRRKDNLDQHLRSGIHWKD